MTYENGVIDCDGSIVDNMTQSDSLTGNVRFYVEQARNNNSFVCEPLG